MTFNILNKKNMSEKKRIALVLSGGGAKGAFQAGVLHQMHNLFDLEYEVVAGVSVGSLNGAMVAQGKVDRLVEVWKSITNDQVYEKKSLLKVLWQYAKHKTGIDKAPYGLYSNEPLYELIQRELKYEDLKTTFLSGRVNIETRAYESFIDANNFHKQVLASTAIPVVWEPTKIGEHFYVDGGVRNITPLSDVLKFDPDVVIVITTEPYNLNKIHNWGYPKDIVGVAQRTLSTLLNETFRNDIKQFLAINDLVKQAEDNNITLYKPDNKPYKYFENIIISPSYGLGDALDFSKKQIDKRFNHGLQLANNYELLKETLR